MDKLWQFVLVHRVKIAGTLASVVALVPWKPEYRFVKEILLVVIAAFGGSAVGPSAAQVKAQIAFERDGVDRRAS